MYPFIVIALGIAVLLFGNRLAVLGAAVGGLVGVVLLQLFPEATLTTQLLIVLGLALGGFLAAAFARGVIEVVILVIGALGGAAAVLVLLNLFNVNEGLLNWLLAIVGGVVGLMLIRRSRRGSRDWGMVILADLVGALLILRGLGLLFPTLRETVWSTLILLGLLVAGGIYQGGFLNRRKAARPAPAKPVAKAEPKVEAKVPTAPVTPIPPASSELPASPVPPVTPVPPPVPPMPPAEPPDPAP